MALISLATQILAGWAIIIIVSGAVLGIVLIALIINIVKNSRSKRRNITAARIAEVNKESIEKSLQDNAMLRKKGDNYYYGDYLVANIFLEANRCVLKTYSYYKYGLRIKRSCVYIRITDDATLEQGRYLCVVACQSVGIL